MRPGKFDLGISKLIIGATLLAWAVTARPVAQAQTFTVLYTFTNTAQGEQPDAGVIADAAGNLYGTTQYGGTAGGFGTIFRLEPTAMKTSCIASRERRMARTRTPDWLPIRRETYMERACTVAHKADLERFSS